MHFKVLSAWSEAAASTASHTDGGTSFGSDEEHGDGIDYGKAFYEKKFHKCSVVSNSGVLGRHKHGKVIDTADMVLRFNDAPLEEYSQFVGTKDDIRIVNE